MIRLYRAALWLLPGELRRQFGDEMVATVERLSRQRERSGRLLLSFSLIGDVLVNAWRLRRQRSSSAHALSPDGANVALLFRRAGGAGSPDRSRCSGSAGVIGGATPPGGAGFPGIDALAQDLRLAARTLRRRPGYATVAVLTLALGLGANLAVFSVFDAVLLRPLPYADADRLVVLAQTIDGNPINSTYPDVVAWNGRAELFSGITGFDDRKVFQLTGGDQPQRVYGATTTANFFETLGVEAILGRTFRPDDDTPEAARVVVLSERLWRTAFGADEAIVGSDVRMNGEPYTVIGVAPASLRIPNREDLWVPLATHPYDDDRLQTRRTHFLEAIGRLAPGATLEQGQAEISAFADALAEAHPDEMRGKGATAWSLREQVIGSLGPAIELMFAAVGVVLLIAVVNVVNMELARAAERRREISLRLALGAGRWQLVRQQLAESGVLALAGGLLGLLVARLLLSAMFALDPDVLPRGIEPSLHAGVVAFCAGLVLLVTAIAVLAPVLLAGSQRLAASLQRSGAGGSGGSLPAMRARKALVVAEVAMSLVLLVGAALLIQSMARTTGVDTGFATDRVLTARIDLPAAAYDAAAQARFFDELRGRLVTLPRVEAVGLSSRLPLSEGTSTSAFYVEGLGDVPEDELPSAHIRFVTPGFFSALQIPLLRGRVFDENDGVSSFGVIVDEQLAEQVWPGESALGKRVRQGEGAPWVPVVGVVGNTRHWGQRFAPTQTLYVPFRMIPSPTMMVALRTDGAPAALAPTLREIVAELDAALPVTEVQTMEQRLAATLTRPRFNTALLTTFAALAVALGALGLYGTIAWSVAQRRGEIGVRMALGALRADVRRMVVGQGLRLTLVGIALGIPAALLAARLLETMLFQIEPNDPLTVALVTVVIGAVAVAASWIPARRATRVDPVTSLRGE